MNIKNIKVRYFEVKHGLTQNTYTIDFDEQDIIDMIGLQYVSENGLPHDQIIKIAIDSVELD